MEGNPFIALNVLPISIGRFSAVPHWPVLGVPRGRAIMVGSLEEYPTESAARKAPSVQAILLRLNAEQPAAAAGAAEFGAVIARYEKEEMPERYSTRAAYKSYIKNHILPRWADTPMSAVRPMAVEDWLKGLDLAPKTKSHVHDFSMCGKVGVDGQESHQTSAGEGWDEAPKDASSPHA
jgi:hypothetical protein